HRFLEEARVTAQLQHPGLVPVYELGMLEDGRPFFTMREVHGWELGAVIAGVHAASHAAKRWAAADGWTLRRLVSLLHRACEAIGYAHVRGVIHRDLKPANILVGAHDEVLVLDWGVAKAQGLQ